MLRILTLLLLIFSYTAKSADFEKFFPHLIKVEGTFFTVTQYDAGGATKFGVTYQVYKTWCNGKRIEIVPCDKDGDGRVTSNDLRLTVLNDVKPIYRYNYWNLCKADYIVNQSVAEILVDMVVHCGVGYNSQHIKAFQRILKVTQDGKIGVKTLQAANHGNSKKIYIELSKYRKAFYKKLTLRKPTQKRFLKGWYNRLNILKSIHYENEKLTFVGSGVEPVACIMQYKDSRTSQGFCFERKSNGIMDYAIRFDTCQDFRYSRGVAV